MKHQGQTMSETMSMVSLGWVFMRWSFPLEVTALCPDAARELPNVNIITAERSFVDLFMLTLFPETGPPVKW